MAAAVVTCTKAASVSSLDKATRLRLGRLFVFERNSDTVKLGGVIPEFAKELVNPKKKLHIVFLVLLATVSTMTFMAPLCGFMFKCGCVWNWAGADSHCNIHHALPPHCPWCAHGKLGYALPIVALTLGQFTGGLVTLRLSGKLALSGLATVLSILPVAFVLGYLTILLTSYPYFLTTY